MNLVALYCYNCVIKVNDSTPGYLSIIWSRLFIRIVSGPNSKIIGTIKHPNNKPEIMFARIKDKIAENVPIFKRRADGNDIGNEHQ